MKDFSFVWAHLVLGRMKCTTQKYTHVSMHVQYARALTHTHTHSHRVASHLLLYTAALMHKSVERRTGHVIKPVNARTMHILYFVIETRCVYVCVLVWRDGATWREKGREVEREQHEALSLRLHKTKSTVMSFSCALVSPRACTCHSCVRLNVGVRACVCVRWQCSHSVYSSPSRKETFSIMFLIGERKDTTRQTERGAGEMNRLWVWNTADMI